MYYDDDDTGSWKSPTLIENQNKYLEEAEKVRVLSRDVADLVEHFTYETMMEMF